MLAIARALVNTTKQLYPACSNWTRHFSSIQSFQVSAKSALLTCATPSLTQSSGFKVMGKVRLRCKDCFFVRRQERLYVICKTHGRHKQMASVKSPRNTWILSHATQSKVRPWWNCIVWIDVLNCMLLGEIEVSFYKEQHIRFGIGVKC